MPNIIPKKYSKFGTLISFHIGINTGIIGIRSLSKKDILPEEFKLCAVVGGRHARMLSSYRMEKALHTPRALKLNRHF